MIDLNTLISNALTAAINSAVAPLNERIAALEEKVNALTARVVPLLLEDPAQGMDTTLVQRIEALEDKVVTGSLRSGLTRDEVEALIEQAIDNHCETYDHDSYDNAVSDLEDRDFVTNDSLEDAVREAVGNLSFDISVS